MLFFFFQAEDGIRDLTVTGVQTCALPISVSSAGVAGTGLAVTFSPGYGLASGGTPGTVPGQLTLTPQAPAVLPGLATQRFLTASNANVGSTVKTFINGTPVSVKIVAAVSNFPTVSGRGGGLIVDLGSVQAMLASRRPR